MIIPSADKRALPPETDGRAEARSPGGFERNGCRDLTTKAVGGTNPSTTTYAYDSLNRLTSISGAVTASYRYNGDGLRVGKTFGTPSPSYVRGPTGSGWPLSGGTSAYVWGQGLISSIAGSGNGMTTYALKNALQNPILQLARSGSLTAAVTFDAFGNPTSQSSTPSAVGFTGGITDPETGFPSLKARYYAPSIGRFTSRDPLPGITTDPATQNGYSYAKDNPTRSIDPSGTDAMYGGCEYNAGYGGCLPGRGGACASNAAYGGCLPPPPDDSASPPGPFAILLPARRFVRIGDSVGVGAVADGRERGRDSARPNTLPVRSPSFLLPRRIFDPRIAEETAEKRVPTPRRQIRWHEMVSRALHPGQGGHIRLRRTPTTGAR